MTKRSDKRYSIAAVVLVALAMLLTTMPSPADATVVSQTKSYGSLKAKLVMTYYSKSCDGVTGYKITVSSIIYTRSSGGSETVLSRSGKVGQVGADCDGDWTERRRSFPTGAVNYFPSSFQVSTGWSTYVIPATFAPSGSWHLTKVSRGGGGYTYLCNKLKIPGADSVYCSEQFT